jgi:hypothetical protein
MRRMTHNARQPDGQTSHFLKFHETPAPATGSVLFSIRQLLLARAQLSVFIN